MLANDAVQNDIGERRERTAPTCGPRVSVGREGGEGAAAAVARPSWAGPERERGEGEGREGGRAGRWGKDGPAGRMREREGGTKNWLFFFQNNFPTSFSNSFWNHFEFWIKPLNPINKMLQHECINMYLSLRLILIAQKLLFFLYLNAHIIT